jgi:hypothetical protein
MSGRRHSPISGWKAKKAVFFYLFGGVTEGVFPTLRGFITCGNVDHSNFGERAWPRPTTLSGKKLSVQEERFRTGVLVVNAGVG